MCGRYYIAEDDQAEELRQIIDMINRKNNGEGAVKTSGEIFPSETVPVIAASRSHKIMPFAMEWATALLKEIALSMPEAKQPLRNQPSETACCTDAASFPPAGTLSGTEMRKGNPSTPLALNTGMLSTWRAFTVLSRSGLCFPF